MLKSIASLYQQFPTSFKGKSLFISHPLLVSPSQFIAPLLLAEVLSSSSYLPIFIATSEHFQHYQSILKKVAGGLNLHEKVEAEQLIYIDMFSNGSANLNDTLPLAAAYPPTFTDSIPNKVIHILPIQPLSLVQVIQKAAKNSTRQLIVVSDGVLETLHLAGGLSSQGVLGFVNQIEKLGAKAFWTWNSSLLTGEQESEELDWKCCRQILRSKAEIRLNFKENLAGFSLDVDGSIEIEIKEDKMMEKVRGYNSKRELKYKLGDHALDIFISASV